jgi:hypothetical protein
MLGLARLRGRMMAFARPGAAGEKFLLKAGIPD